MAMFVTGGGVGGGSNCSLIWSTTRFYLHATIKTAQHGAFSLSQPQMFLKIVLFSKNLKYFSIWENNDHLIFVFDFEKGTNLSKIKAGTQWTYRTILKWQHKGDFTSQIYFTKSLYQGIYADFKTCFLESSFYIQFLSILRSTWKTRAVMSIWAQGRNQNQSELTKMKIDVGYLLMAYLAVIIVQRQC